MQAFNGMTVSIGRGRTEEIPKFVFSLKELQDCTTDPAVCNMSQDSIRKLCISRFISSLSWIWEAEVVDLCVQRCVILPLDDDFAYEYSSEPAQVTVKSEEESIHFPVIESSFSMQTVDETILTSQKNLVTESGSAMSDSGQISNAVDQETYGTSSETIGCNRTSELSTRPVADPEFDLVMEAASGDPVKDKVDDGFHTNKCSVFTTTDSQQSQDSFLPNETSLSRKSDSHMICEAAADNCSGILGGPPDNSRIPEQSSKPMTPNGSRRPHGGAAAGCSEITVNQRELMNDESYSESKLSGNLRKSMYETEEATGRNCSSLTVPVGVDIFHNVAKTGHSQPKPTDSSSGPRLSSHPDGQTGPCRTDKQSRKIEVMQADNCKGKRKFDKRYFCPYCSSPIAKLPRHLLSQHANEMEVIKLKMEKNNVTRKKILLKLRNLGNHKHNTEVLVKQSGQLIVKYRPDSHSAPDRYVPCIYCLGYYLSRDLSRHVRRCPLVPAGERTGGPVVQRARLLLSAGLTSS